MELICAFVLTFVSLVTAVPHDYSVKGGASAKADASAAAGAFSGLGAVPYSVPSGTGFSGSFSKSSSSSFASSSASSSASSFSFGGSGTGLSGTNGLAGQGAAGCTSGACQKGGVDGLTGSSYGSDNTGSGFAFGNANAGASAGAGSSGAAGQGAAGCTSGACQKGGVDGLTGSSHGSENTGSGLAFGNANAGASAGAGSGAIAKDGNPQSCIGEDCSNQYSNSNVDGANDGGALSGSKSGSQVPCIGGDCSNHFSKTNFGSGTSAGAGALAGSGHGNQVPCISGDCSKQKTSGCQGSTCSESDSGCTTGACRPASPTTEYGSNDIPVNIGSHGSKTTSGSKDHQSPNDDLPFVALDSFGSDCAAGNCGLPGTPNSKPTYTHGGSGSAPSIPVTYLTAPKETAVQGTTCTSPSCGSSNVNANPGTGSLPLTPNAHTLNTYPSTSSGYYNQPSYHVPLPSTGSVNCATGNCDNYPAIQTSSGSGTLSSSSHGTPISYFPTGPTGSAGCTTPNCAPVQKNPIYTELPSNAPSVGSGSSSCSTPNCASFPAIQGPVIGTGSYGLTKPNVGVSATGQKLPAYTGGFGGPSGILKPNEFSPPAKPIYTHQQPTLIPIPPSGAAIPSYVHGTSNALTPTGQLGSTSCGNSNCAEPSVPSSHVQPPYTGSSVSNIASSETSSSAGSLNSNVGGSSTAQKLPAYTNGFGGPPGILKPNDYTVPSKVPFTQHQPAINPISPAGNAVNPISPVSNTHIPGSNYKIEPAGAYKPVACTSGNCDTTGTSNAANVAAGAVASANAVSYTGGFGGPPGLLRPHDNGKLASVGSTDFGGQYSTGLQVDAHHGNIAGAIPLSKISNEDRNSAQANAGGQAIAGSQTNAGDKSGAGTQSGAGAQAGAAAGSFASAFGTGYNQGGDHGIGNQAGGGCDGGCGSAGGAGNFGFGAGLGLSKIGLLDPTAGGSHAAGASAKSLAGAGSFGLGGSFASSAATAHASSGFATKGGYGRR